MRRTILVVWSIACLSLGSCVGAKSPDQAVIGRWQLVQDTSLYASSAFAHDIELRDGGQWIILQIGGDRSYTIAVNHYSFPADDKIQITAWCYQGYARSECTGEFNFGVDGKTLNIFDDTGHSAVYKRMGDVESSLPPTIVPPFATSVPTP